jgi:hypothetical protein
MLAPSGPARLRILQIVNIMPDTPAKKVASPAPGSPAPGSPKVNNKYAHVKSKIGSLEVECPCGRRCRRSAEALGREIGDRIRQPLIWVDSSDRASPRQGKPPDGFRAIKTWACEIQQHLAHRMVPVPGELPSPTS